MAMTASGHLGDFEVLLKEIIETTTFFPTPPKGFDPRSAEPDRLVQFGLPPKPDRKTQPEEYAFWQRLFSPPLSFMPAVFSFQLPVYRIDGSIILPLSSTRYEASRNWSGAYITPTQGRMFTEVQGTWQVPTPTPPVARPGAVPEDGDYRCSTWIGLDGQRQYLNSSLPQIGTTQSVTVVNGQAMPPTVSAWWQWWVRGLTQPIVTLSLPVKPGDLIMAKLTVIDLTTVRFYIKNETTGAFVAPFDRPAPQLPMKQGPSPIQLEIAGATAEWVTERPTNFANGQLYELADYGTVVFSNCLAVAARRPGSIGVEQKLPGARLINMYKVKERPHRAAFISMARREGDEDVATFYR
jgi:Peptidase A4 family